MAIALEDLSGAAEVRVLGGPNDARLQLCQDVPFAHKVAVRPISKGDAVLKYGVPIAFATADILAGEWVHTHNVESYFAALRKEHKL